MLIARDGGCTKPGCTVPAYGSQVHHAARDWADGGQTNVDELGLACGPDNRAVGPERLDHPDQRRQRRRMDSTAGPRHRPGPRQRAITAPNASTGHPTTHLRPSQAADASTRRTRTQRRLAGGSSPGGKSRVIRSRGGALRAGEADQPRQGAVSGDGHDQGGDLRVLRRDRRRHGAAHRGPARHPQALAERRRRARTSSRSNWRRRRRTGWTEAP